MTKFTSKKVGNWPTATEATQLLSTKNRSLNYSSNVLLMYRATSLRNISGLNFIATILCLVYCGINICLLYFNYENSRAKSIGEEPIVTHYVFHQLEFWGTFGFALVELFALSQTPKSLVSTVNNPRLLKVIMFLNVVATLIPAVLVTVNMERFEVLSHELEYLSDITMAFVELVLLFSLVRRSRRADTDNLMIDGDREDQNKADAFGNDASVTLSVIALILSFTQLAIYNGSGRSSSGGMVGETRAHYCEFTFQICSSLIAFWFTLDNMLIADEELAQILFGNHEDCKVCATHAHSQHQTSDDVVA